MQREKRQLIEARTKLDPGARYGAKMTTQTNNLDLTSVAALTDALRGRELNRVSAALTPIDRTRVALTPNGAAR